MSRKDLGARLVGGDDAGATILHVDMDAFFVAVELLERPELVGRPVVVGGAGGRGVVSSASYEARAFGVRSAMPMARALQLCPHAVVLPGRMERYRRASAEVMAVFADFTPLVEPLSIDEAFLDVSGATRLFGSPAEIARRIRAEVHARTGLTCSVGAASTKFVAKLASGKCKPNGMLVVPDAETVPFLHALPVGALWGVGETTERKLRSRGVSTVHELAHTPEHVLERLLGRAMAERLADLAWGRDAREVVVERREKSVSHEQTFEVDVTSHAELEREVRAQADAVGARLRRAGLVASTVAVKLRWANFETVTRQERLERPSSTGLVLFRAAARLLAELHSEGRPVRLIGVRADGLSPAGDATAVTLWDEGGDDDWEAAEQTVDAATARFGRDALRPASLLGRRERRDRGTGLSERPNRPSQGVD
ncbi:MAG: DNA polymerase IV [Microbacteriaceae bacterium]|nr:DNA polymerase IV [Microbacteriaceae bacterium]